MLDSSDAGDYAETDPSGRYGRFNEVLGKGAMKTVYRAFDELNGLEVAWNQAKLCNVMRSPDALQRMYSEVHLLGTLNHKSIIRFYTSWVDPKNQTFNFITELFTSGTLRQYRQRYRRVNIRAVKNWACQILHGLVYLHGHDPPVIHRDLKCDNIFVNGHLGQVKIGDLGLAAVLRGTQNAHSVIGTPEFMAPELYEEDYNQLVDIYSFGMCVLEMLTSEYPYSECSNPAQIYKKVTSGKLPHGFHRVQDPEAKRFIYRCLQNVSMRSSASELLLDPFLMFNEPRRNPNLLLTGTETHRTEGGHGRLNITSPARPADMTITGKMNPEDEKIELNVQIADKHGSVRRIQFPFDILSDTPIDVANEMVKELEITDRDPSEIAEVIRQEILYLVPDWNAEEPPERWLSHQVYSYGDDGLGHPFYSSSSPTSSHFSDIGASSSHGEHGNHADWLQSGMFSDDDDTSSMNSGKFSATYYLSADADEQVNPAILRAQAIPKNQKFTRFGPEDGALAAKFSEQCSVGEPEPSSGGSTSRGGKKGVRALMRNRSMVDFRSQLLNRTLVEGLKKRLFKTVGAVEHIGFRMPADEGSRRPPTSPKGDRKKGLMWGRG